MSVLLPPEGQCVLVIQAHPDDAEWLCAGTVALLIAEGCAVHYLFITRGDQGSNDPAMTQEQIAVIREREQRQAADLLGVKSVTFLEGYGDGEVEATMGLRRDLVGAIRQLKPNIIFSFDPWGSNGVHAHPDHRAAAVCTLDAIAVARNRFTYPEQLIEGITEHSVQQVYFYGTDRPNHWVDITTTLEQKLAALHLHASQMGPQVDERIRRRAIQAGAAPKYTYAEQFHRYTLA